MRDLYVYFRQKILRCPTEKLSNSDLGCSCHDYANGQYLFHLVVVTVKRYSVFIDHFPLCTMGKPQNTVTNMFPYLVVPSDALDIPTSR